MFDKSNFAQIIKNIKETYDSQEEFSKKSGIGRTSLSQYMNMQLDKPPLPRMLEKLANASHGITTYKDLMRICGYSEKTLESKVYSIYNKLKNYYNISTNKKDVSLELDMTIEEFQNYISMLSEYLKFSLRKKIFLDDICTLSHAIEDYKYIAGFLLLYNEFLMLLEFEDYIDVSNYIFIDYSNIENIYNNLGNFEDLELFSLDSKNVTFKDYNKDLNNIIAYLDSVSRYLSLSYFSEFDSNSLIELFKKKIESDNTNLSTANELTNKNKSNKEIDSDGSISYSEKFYMCPVYGRISAGQPNWAEECIEGRIPIDPVLFDIINPEEHFFLRVNGESMNEVIRDGSYALIHKQDVVENGEIAVVLVNGDEATIKKFSKQGDLVILEPMSNDTSFTTQVYSKDTQIKILGKYIGKFEINK